MRAKSDSKLGVDPEQGKTPNSGEEFIDGHVNIYNCLKKN